jgi:putative transposase
VGIDDDVHRSRDDAWNQGVHARCTMLVGLVTHSDAGSQYTSIRYTERLAGIGAQPSIGTVGDSYDNAMAEFERTLQS